MDKLFKLYHIDQYKYVSGWSGKKNDDNYKKEMDKYDAKPKMLGGVIFDHVHTPGKEQECNEVDEKPLPMKDS